jgi:hypothetical protein
LQGLSAPAAGTCAWVTSSCWAAAKWWPQLRKGEEQEVFWLLPGLNALQGPGSAIGSFIRGLQRKGGQQQLAAVSMKGLPPDPSAAGIRKGVVNTLGLVMPWELGSRITDHVLEGLGAFFEYFDCQRPAMVAGARVLAGFRPPPWGQPGLAPKQPSLAPVLESGVSAERLELTSLMRCCASTLPATLRCCVAATCALWPGALWPL